MTWRRVFDANYVEKVLRGCHTPDDHGNSHDGFGVGVGWSRRTLHDGSQQAGRPTAWLEDAGAGNDDTGARNDTVGAKTMTTMMTFHHDQ